MFQTDTIGIRATLDISFAMRADNMITFMTGCTWGAA
jgi:hypothetical protein